MFGWKKKYEKALADAEFYRDKSVRLENELARTALERNGLHRKVYGHSGGLLGALGSGFGLLAQNAALENRIAALAAELERERRLNLDQFTNDEIKTLISLCHPDKHGGKESAVRITQKLLKLRG